MAKTGAKHIELVQWLDPHTEMDWATGDNGTHPCTCFSVGRLISECSEFIVLAGDWDDGEETNTRMVIIKGCIVSRTVIHSF